MKLKTFRFAPLAAVLLAAVFLHGCGYRAEAAPLASNAPAVAETTPAPTETPVFTVEYRLGDNVLQTESIPFDGTPAADAALPEGLYLVAWTDETGRRADPAAPVETDTVYYALARPVLNAGAAFLFMPAISSVALGYVMAAYLMVGGVSLLAEALTMKPIER